MIILGSSYIPITPLLQSGGSSQREYYAQQSVAACDLQSGNLGGPHALTAWLLWPTVGGSEP